MRPLLPSAALVSLVYFLGCQNQAGPTSSTPASLVGRDAQAVAVTGGPSNRIVARNDFYRVVQGGTLIIPPPGVLRNDMVPAGVVASVEFVVATLPPTSFTNTGGNGGFILDLSVTPALSGPLSFDYFFHTPTGNSNVATVTVQVAPSGSRLGNGVTDQATGSGSFIFAGNNRTFSFTARRHADGTVSGQWERVNHVGNASQTKSHGQVTCFTILAGNQARLGGIATSGLFSTPPNNEVLWRVADNGQGASSPPDQISSQFVGVPPGTAAPYCAGAFGNMPALNNVVAGNIQVRP